MNTTVWRRSSAASASTLSSIVGDGAPAQWAQVAAKVVGADGVPGAVVVSENSAVSLSKFQLINYPVEILTALNH